MTPKEYINTLSPDVIRAALLAKGWTVDEKGCHRWKGTKSTVGYPLAIIAGRRVPAHRANFVASHGPLDVRLDACHHCDVRDCINPEHIFGGSRSENMLDADRKQRTTYRKNPALKPSHAKLTPEQVLFIRQSPMSGAAIGRLLGVDRTTVSKVRVGTTWTKDSPDV